MMITIDLGTVKLRFDPNDIRISIDGDKIDVGARMKEPLPEINEDFGYAGPGLFKMEEDKLEKQFKKSKRRR